MFRFAFSIMGLHNTAQAIGFRVELIRVTTLVSFDFQEIFKVMPTSSTARCHPFRRQRSKFL